MGKSNQVNGKDIRYHRVDISKKFVLDDEEDTDSELERDLGPPSKRGAAGSTSEASDAHCCVVLRSGCIAFTVIITLAGLAGVVIYSSVLFPLKDGSVFVSDQESSSYLEDTLSNLTLTHNSTDDGTSSNSTQPPPITTSSAVTKVIDSEIKSDQEIKTIPPKGTDEKKNKRHNRHRQEDGGKAEKSFVDSGFFVPKRESGLSNEEEIERLGSLIDQMKPLFWDGNVEDGKEIPSPSINDASADKIKNRRDMFGTEKPEIFSDIQSTSTTQVTTTLSTQTSSESTTIKSSTSTTQLLTTTKTNKPENVTANATVAEDEHNKNQTSYKDQITKMAYKIWSKYRANDTYVISSIAGIASFFIVLIIGCLICRYRARVEAKKRHFKRLITDLNATEKFSIVTPSEDELSD